MQDDLLDESRTGAHQAVELGAGWQRGEGVEQVGFGVAVEVPLAVETAPTGEDGQGYDLAFGEGGLGSGPLFRPTGLAEVVGDDVECGEEGVHVDHESSVPFPKGSVGKPTLMGGHLPLKSSRSNSHQAFKGLSVLNCFLTPAPACVSCAVYRKTIRHAQQDSDTSVWVLSYCWVFWDVGRR